MKKQSLSDAILRIKDNSWELFLFLQQRCLYQWKAIRLKKYSWSAIDKKFVDSFLANSTQEQESYTELFSYLVSGLVYYSASDYTRVYYPGALSVHGADIDAIEGFCRALPMISAWINSGRPSIIKSFDGGEIDLIHIAKVGLLAGTDPKSKGYWGAMNDFDQKIVEAADVALSVWLLRDRLWPQLSLSEKERILNWLSSVNGKAVFDNNWHIFPVIINEVLSSFNYPVDSTLSLSHYSRLKSFYLGNGWFSDGPAGAIDYYNVWGIHYALFWINLINPKLDSDFIDSSLNDFVQNYKYFISTDGIPMIGRSVCYRMAAPAPLIAASLKKEKNINPGMARRGLNCVWKYFINHGAISHGRITQGYWKEDFSLLDNYSGPGSSMWSTRSLALAFYSPSNSDFWMAPLEDLPVEQEDYDVIIPEIGWEIKGYKLTGEVQVIKMKNNDIKLKLEKKISNLHRFFIFALGLPYRSEKRFPKNEFRIYSNINFRPF